MSSATSTDGSTFRPWHFFALSALVAATAGVLLSRDTTPEHIILMSLAIFAAGLAGAALHRTLAPLVAESEAEEAAGLSQRTRRALEREKLLVLRSIKEIEFDRAMGKMSEPDFDEMASRLRARAIALMKQLDEAPSYREMIEREVGARLSGKGAGAAPRPAPVPAAVAVPAAAPDVSSDADDAAGTCGDCGTVNDADARFCKRCGARLGT